MKPLNTLSLLAAITLVSAGTFHPPSQLPEPSIARGFVVQYEDGVRSDEAHSSLMKNKVDYKVQHEYGIFHGAAITVKSGQDGESLAGISGIKNVWPITAFKIASSKKEDLKASELDKTSVHHMTGVDVLHKKYALTGKGIKVGVIDSGIDYTHPAFSSKSGSPGCFKGPGCRVAFGYDFVGDSFYGPDDPVPDPDPMDCNGHGTHVASIIGGRVMGNITIPTPPREIVGVAPEVTLGAYRVFGCLGITSVDVVLAAMELAAADGMDIINLSLGGGPSYKTHPIAVLSDILVTRGVSVSAAAGDDGDSGISMVSDAGLGDLSSSVASFDNAYGLYYSFKYGGKTYPYLPSPDYAKSFDLPSNTTLIPIFDKDGSLSDGCDVNFFDKFDIKDKIVLLSGRETLCYTYDAAATAWREGAVGALFQSVPAGINGIGGVGDFPSGSIDNKSGEKIIATFKKAPKTTFTWNKEQSVFLVEGGGSPSYFSSFGVDGELRSKPDISAPGGRILSAYPVDNGGFAIFSGTSMAAPYITGAHALYWQFNKKKPHGDLVRQTFKNTATIGSNFGSKTKASAAKQGAGLVNVLNAVLTTTSIAPDHIDLLDSKRFKKSVQITINNLGTKTETYTLSHTPADTLNSYKGSSKLPLPTPVIEANYATVKFSSSKVKIPAGKSAKVSLTFTEPNKSSAYKFPLYSGFVVATPASKDGIAVHVPYTGVKGDTSKTPLIDTKNGFPIVYIVNNERRFRPIPGPNYKFNLAVERPVILTRVGSHTPDLVLRIHATVPSSKFVGFANTINYGPFFGPRGRDPIRFRDSFDPFFNAWYWNGTVFRTEDAKSPLITLASGKYELILAAQHRMSRGAYPKDFEVYKLGTVSI